jgi:hypothetical protein
MLARFFCEISNTVPSFGVRIIQKIFKLERHCAAIVGLSNLSDSS